MDHGSKEQQNENKKVHSLQRLVRATRRTKTATITKDYVTFAAQSHFGDVMHK